MSHNIHRRRLRRTRRARVLPPNMLALRLILPRTSSLIICMQSSENCQIREFLCPRMRSILHHKTKKTLPAEAYPQTPLGKCTMVPIKPLDGWGGVLKTVLGRGKTVRGETPPQTFALRASPSLYRRRGPSIFFVRRRLYSKSIYNVKAFAGRIDPCCLSQ